MNILFSLLGIIGWSFAHFYFLKSRKDKAGEKFNYGGYVSERWDDWAWCVFWAIVLLVVGHFGLGMELFRHFGSNLEWSDLYYAASGPISMMAMKAYEEFMNRIKPD